jgi:hypothetical protein
MPRGLSLELRKLEYTCLYVIGPLNGQPVRVDYAGQIHKRFSELQTLSWQPLKLHHIVWTAGRPLAERIAEHAHGYLSARRLNDTWFDVPANLAVNALRIAAEKLNLPTFSHDEMVRRCAAMERAKFERARLGETNGKHPNHFVSEKPKALANYAAEVAEPPPRKRKRKGGRRRAGVQATKAKPHRDHPFR